MAPRAFDGPALASSDQLHGTPLAPPVLYFCGQSHPDRMVCTELVEIGEQRFVDILRARLCDIIRVDEKAHQSMTTQEERALLLPQRNRILRKNVEQAVILDGS